MRELNVKTSVGSYNIFINDKNFEKLKEMVSKYSKILILTNKTVGSLYGEIIKKALEDFQIFYIEIENGEKHKNYKSAEEVYDFLIENHFYRDSLIITLGGGVICDLGGYIAATYMRGIDFLQIPTTLLAQVDASIGGKVAINYKNIKNIVGAFYPPKGVFIDPQFLKTLPEREFKSGMVEVIKHALLSKNENEISFLENRSEEIKKMNLDILEEMIEHSCAVKKEYVEVDEHEKGVRAFLNLGHTYGHTLESIYHLKNITHGEGVAKGIIFEMDLFSENNRLRERVLKLFERYEIDCFPVYINENTLIKNMKKDKKNIDNKLTFINLKEIGEAQSKKIEVEKVIELNDKFKESYRKEIKAVIDVGTNSTRLFISEVEKNQNEIKIVKSIYKWVEITSLGKGLNEKKILTEAAMKRTLDVIEEFYKKGINYGATSVEAYATSAVRDAKNREDFMKKVRDIGVNIQCISGEMEAKLPFIGIASIHREKKIGIIDIGGGSTEISIGKNESIELSKSFNVGAVRVTEMFFQKIKNDGSIEENYNFEKVKEATEWIKSQFQPLKEFKDKDFILLGVAGTVSKQVTILEKMDVYDSKKIDRYPLTLKNIEDNYELLLGKTLEERMKLPGLEPKRAEYVIAGTLILKLLMSEIFEKDKIIFSEVDNLEGSVIHFG